MVGVIKEDGTFQQMDSLNIIDLVVELETAANISIPADRVNAETFRSIESIAELLKQLQA